ncbi:hypothetical protein N9M26_06040 [Alphaproteobacteria bacterium]|nr:hypothetical protein [Alphaproteobacteria bacterium]
MKKFTLDFSIGGFRSENHKIFNEDFDLIIEIDFFPNRKTVSQYKWEEFWKTIDEIDAWRWGKDYFNQDILDGTQWELVIDRKGKRRRRVFGSNDYPPNFKIFLDAINKLADTNLVHDEEE